MISGLIETIKLQVIEYRYTRPITLVALGSKSVVYRLDWGGRMPPR